MALSPCGKMRGTSVAAAGSSRSQSSSAGRTSTASGLRRLVTKPPCHQTTLSPNHPVLKTQPPHTHPAKYQNPLSTHDCYRCVLQLLCLVGEAFDDHSDDVCGAVVNIRTKGDKIALWTTDYDNKDGITHIG